MGKMANILTERQQGSLPSNSEKNHKGDGREHVKAITLRSGSELATQGPPQVHPRKLEARGAALRGEASRDTK